jgi:hypothetical protein
VFSQTGKPTLANPSEPLEAVKVSLPCRFVDLRQIKASRRQKELTGDIEIEISNQCARLVANVIIHYNSAILSRLFTSGYTAS